MKVIVTGGLGHIGSAFLHNAPALLPGSEIITIDNLSTQRYCSLFNLPKRLKHHFVEGDLRNADFDTLLPDAAAVVHLGATTDAAGTASNPNLIFENNLPSTKLLAEACIRHDVPLIFPSSTSVYGVQEGLVDEQCENLKPQSPYADCKIQEENMIREMGEKGLRFCLSRFGTVYGISPGMRFHTAVNKFCWQAAMEQPITVWSTAMDQKRPYLGLKDACRFIADTIKYNRFDNKLYNALTDNFTVRNVIDTIRTFVPDLEIKYVDNMIMNQLSYEVSNVLAEKAGYAFEDNLHTCVGETISLLKQDFIGDRACA